MVESHSEEDFFFNKRKEEKANKKIAGRTDRSRFKKTDQKKKQPQTKSDDLPTGRVLAILPEGIIVETAGKELMCTLAGVLKKDFSRKKNLLTIGDFVFYDGERRIVRVQERRSVLSRREHLRRHQEQLIAANIDQVLITVSVGAPPLKPALVDRYIIATQKGHMAPLIVINKIDLLETHPEEKALLEAFLPIYKSLGIPTLLVSASTGEGIELLRKQMAHKSSVFSGQSGVGKSALIQAVTGVALSTGTLTKKTLKGSHTTTKAILIPLGDESFCIDTPGIRSFGVWDLKREDLESYFPEIHEVGMRCHFPNCTHSHEPDCAVQQAASEERISLLRLNSYLKLLEETI